MRVSGFRLFLVAIAGAFALACDSSGTDSARREGRVTIPFPRLGAVKLASQTADAFEPRTIQVKISVVRTGQILLETAIADDDPRFVEDQQGDGSDGATLTLDFRYPAELAGEAFQFEASAFSASNVLLMTMGPVTFHLNADGSSGNVEVALNYVGPGRDVTSVTISPRSITVNVGATLPISCIGNPGNVTTFPYEFVSSNESVAIIEGTQVRGIGAGSATISCELRFSASGTGSDAIPVTVTNLTTTGGISGTIRNNSSTPLNGMLVQLRSGSGNTTGTVLNSATTGTGGTFSFSNLPAGAYTLQVSGSGFTTQSVNTTVIAGQTASVTVTMQSAAAPGTLTGTVRDASSATVQSGATVEVRIGANVTTGSTVFSVVTGATGGFTTSLSPGQYTVRVTKSGYTDFSQTINVSSAQTTNLTVSLSSVLPSGEVRITVTWTNANLDLDSRLTLPNGDIVAYYSHNSDGGCLVTNPPFACLEQDRTGGADGVTETIRIAQFGAFGATNYVYSVHDFTADFTNTETSTSLAQSGAHVTVNYGSNQVAQFDVPSQSGNLWTVFRFAAAPPQLPVTINTMSVLNEVTVHDLIRSGLQAPSEMKRLWVRR